MIFYFMKREIFISFLIDFISFFSISIEIQILKWKNWISWTRRFTSNPLRILFQSSVNLLLIVRFNFDGRFFFVIFPYTNTSETSKFKSWKVYKFICICFMDLHQKSFLKLCHLIILSIISFYNCLLFRWHIWNIHCCFQLFLL